MLKHKCDHSGYIESCHERKNASYYRKLKSRSKCGTYLPTYSRGFCDRLEEGSFIPCGTSGCLAYRECFDDGIPNYRTVVQIPVNHLTCGYVFGKLCYEQKLVRRWSCCKMTIIGTMADMDYVRCKNPIKQEE